MDSPDIPSSDNYTIEVNVTNNSISYCLEIGKDKNGNQYCIECVENALFYNNNTICRCINGYFGKNNECYKCDDEYYGIPGCLISEGCNYINYQLKCNKCKTGYYKNKEGFCIRCISSIVNCIECHNDNKGELKCDKCLNNYYTLNKEKNICELNECQEYPDIAPGCIICKDKLNEYKPYNKCQTCKYGYFKTKNEKCVYSRSEQYGGPACYECGYEKDIYGNDTDNIICNDCENFNDYYRNNYAVLSPQGKCYNCKYELSESCKKCEFTHTKKEDKLICSLCEEGYYLNSEGKCISIYDKIISIPNCASHNFSINGHEFRYISSNNYIYSLSDYFDIGEEINEYLLKLKSSINTTCEYCLPGYFLNDNKKCEILSSEKCTGKFILNNRWERLYSCDNICYQNDFPLISLKLGNNKYEEYYETIFDILYNYVYGYNDSDELNNGNKNYILNSNLCYNISDERIKYKYEGCEKVIYINKTKSYQCVECKYDYKLDEINHICHKKYYNNNSLINCDIENIGNKSPPVYSCKKCDNYEQTLVTIENGVKIRVDNYLLENCFEGNAKTEYIKPVYNCSSCINNNYTIYNSSFYQKTICKGKNETINKGNSSHISLDIFKYEDSISTTKGICDKNIFFTPDKNKCYKCDNKNVGMPGCKSNCSFSFNRSNAILCESECKEDGYIESSKGICETCESINEGCYKCHYENNYPNNYFGVKLSRRFQCDYCENGYILSNIGKCFKCSNLNGCQKCIENNITGNFKCIKCSEHYYLNENGHCEECVITHELLNNKCIKCDDINQGGIKNCYFCQKNQEVNGLICRQCKEGYILYNNTCLNRNNFTQFDSCLELQFKNNRYHCITCKPEFSLLKNESKCVYTPTLYDEFFYLYYQYKFGVFFVHLDNNIENEYSYKQIKFLPCKESINLGKIENPNYSCNKCYYPFDNEEYDLHYYNKDFPVMINDKTLKNNYCLESNEYLNNCLEADYYIFNHTEKYNCTKCMKNYKLEYNKTSKINYCSLIEENILEKEKCLVKYCSNCISGNINFCQNCSSTDYEINNITGSCVKKTEKIPSITWKDIYKFNKKGQKKINGKIIEGPSFILRGITCSQIMPRHAFLIYIVFESVSKLRTLEENLKIPTICETSEELDETNTTINIIDYECIGIKNLDENHNYTISKIEEDNTTQSNNIINSNINDIELSKNIETKKSSDFSLNNANNIINFVVSQISQNNNSFSIKGELSKEISQNKDKLRSLSSICSDTEIELNISNNKVNCTFCSDKKDANLTCPLDFQEETKENSIYLNFKNKELKLNDNSISIYLTNLNNTIQLKPSSIIPYPSEKPSSSEKPTPSAKPSSQIPPHPKESSTSEPKTSGGEQSPSSTKSKKNNDNKTTIIVCIIVGIIFLAGLIVGIILLIKVIKNKKKKELVNNSKISETPVNDSYKSDISLDKDEQI